MLIYNFQKEFIGIDEADLEVFGFANLSELKAEASDFADMFVRTPGYIHNFKHVHWIDFVTCADPSEESKVIIEVNSKTYKATIQIETLYLSDNPTSKAYLINLNNLRSLTLKENGEFSEDIARKKPPRIEPSIGHAFDMSQEEEVEVGTAPELAGFKLFEDIKGVQEEEEVQEIKSTAPLDISFDDDDMDESIFASEKEVDTYTEPTAVEDEVIAIDTDLSIDSIELDEVGYKDETDNIPESTQVEEDDGFDYSYNYDPQVASDELGLPIDLIEEFIQDFIAQAKEFKDELYSSLNEGDTDNIKILSHKLKGVAANLRIEDAFNTLSIINTSSDISEVEKYLHIFYKIITKLSGEEIQAAKPVAAQPVQEETQEQPDEKEDDDDLYLDFKEDNSSNSTEAETTTDLDKLEELNQETETSQEDDDLYLDFDVGIKDSEVPEKIEMPELADDEFLNDETKEIDDINDLLSIDEEVNMDQEYEIAIDFDDNSKEEPEEAIEIDYSKELVANEIGLDQESFDEIFEDYIEDSKSSAVTIHKAISEDDYIKCRREALKLKGMSDNMRVNAFTEQLISLINSSDKDELIQAITKIDAVIAQISK